ncbi:tRNA m6A37 methyltransferase TrmN6 [Campylobacter iguaniorum]|uniref:tRNA1(Val) (adenine(37)-N6)-methyltransferase n=1 Tax=Campylobacter iguaniorum TaxID=1244531 RepID=UPI0007C9300F|nr:methyltransferase [Campylobacter iguaniorum]ANE35816.1 tRNA m6A37 methyltransferase TrmN6 [Campylobacter iguaniorum]
MILYQLENGYRYNSDTLFLYDFISKNRLSGNVLDAGCGCGILGLLLKNDFKNIALTSLDIQAINTQITKFNAKQNNLEAATICADFNEFKSEIKFDIVVSNPPFYSDDIPKSQNEHIRLSRYSQSLDFRDMLRSVNAIIKPRGSFYFCYDARRICEVMQGLCEFKFNLTKLRFVHAKANSASKLALFEAKKSSKSKCEILPSLVMFDGENYSKEASEIFAKSNTKSEIYKC